MKPLTLEVEGGSSIRMLGGQEWKSPTISWPVRSAKKVSIEAHVQLISDGPHSKYYTPPREHFDTEPVLFNQSPTFMEGGEQYEIDVSITPRNTIKATIYHIDSDSSCDDQYSSESEVENSYETTSFLETDEINSSKEEIDDKPELDLVFKRASSSESDEDISAREKPISESASTQPEGKVPTESKKQTNFCVVS